MHGIEIYHAFLFYLFYKKKIIINYKDKYINNETMKITIKDKEIELKQSLRTLMLYENITNQSYEGNGNITNIILYFYCNVIASGELYDLGFDEFIDILDNNKNLLSEYVSWLNKTNNMQNLFANPDKKEDNTEKKRKVKKLA